jgi:hypothetical protein
MSTRRFEIVRVVDGASLLDDESSERRYRRADGCALATGHYLVMWPGTVPEAAFDENAEFISPFDSSPAAERALCDVGLGAAWARLVA